MRAEVIGRQIFAPAAPIPDLTPSIDRNQFLRDVAEEVRQAAAYNAGAHRVSEWLDHRRALPRETQNYVERITGRSVEAWRKTPLADAKLTFARPLPCRELPAYADLEQTRREQARLLEQAERLQPAMRFSSIKVAPLSGDVC